MKRCLRFVACLALLLLPLSALAQAGMAQAPAPLTPQEVFKRVSPSVFVVEAVDSGGEVFAFGSGVAVAPDQVVTNQHVVEGAARIMVRRGESRWPAKVTHSNADHDLCRLWVEGLRAHAVEVRRAPGLLVGDKVYAIGAPRGLELTFTEGLISALRDRSGAQIIQTTAAVSPGSSGGGLFDAQGRLVGITTETVKGGQALNFAVPGEWVLALEQSPVGGAGSPRERGAQEALAWFLRASERLDQKQYQQAVEAFREALGLKPDDAEAWTGLSLAYQALEQPDKAIEPSREAVRLYREAVRLKPDDAWAWTRLGLAYRTLEQPDKAIEAYREALQLKPDYAVAWIDLGGTYYELKQWEKAIGPYKEALRLKPDDAETWHNLGDAYLFLPKADKATEAYREALRLKPDDAWAWFNLGVAYNILGQRDKVMEIYRRLRELEPARADEFFRKVVLP